MRKALPAFIVLLAVAAGGAAVYLYQKPGGRGSAESAIAAYLPADTLMLASIPDPEQTLADWKTTDLYKLWMEPEVQAFLEKPLGKIPPNAEVDAALARLQKINPKSLFIALASLEEKTNQPHLLAGFRFKGSNTDVEHLLAGAKEQMRKTFPAGKADLGDYQGRAIESFDTGDGTTIAAVFLDDWYLISNDLPLLKTSVDRFDHRAPASVLSLDKDPEFQAVCAKLPSGAESLLFGRVQPFVSRLLALMAASGQPIGAEQRAELEKIKAIGATTSIDGGKIRDSAYYLAPDFRLDLARLTMGSLSLTSPETVFYLGTMFQAPDSLGLPGTPAPGALRIPYLQDFLDSLSARGLTVADFKTAFNNELGVHIDWPAASQQPSLIASLDVRDKAAASAFLGKLTASPVAGASWQHAQSNGATYHTLATPDLSFLSPTLTLTDKHLILGLNPIDVRAAVAHEQSGGATLAQGDAYKAATALAGKPNAVFSYLDARTTFERVYGIVQPMALMGAAFLLPQANQYVDLSKLPQSGTIAKHLSPIVLSEAIDAQGVSIESVGPVTFSQAGFVVAGASVAIAVPILQKQFGGIPSFTPMPAATPHAAAPAISPAPLAPAPAAPTP